MNLRVALGIGGMTLAVIAGCPSQVTLPSKVDLPANAEFVENNPGAFKTTVDDAAIPGEVGVVVDELASLSGCFAAVLTEPGNAIALYAIFRFDAAGGSYEAASFVGNVEGGILASSPIATVDRGTLAVLSANQLRLTPTELFSNVTESGEILSTVDQPATPSAGGFPSTDITVTLDGDTLVIWYDDGSVVAFRRFDCVE